MTSVVVLTLRKRLGLTPRPFGLGCDFTASRHGRADTTGKPNWSSEAAKKTTFTVGSTPRQHDKRSETSQSPTVACRGARTTRIRVRVGKIIPHGRADAPQSDRRFMPLVNGNEPPEKCGNVIVEHDRDAARSTAAASRSTSITSFRSSTASCEQSQAIWFFCANRVTTGSIVAETLQGDF